MYEQLLQIFSIQYYFYCVKYLRQQMMSQVLNLSLKLFLIGNKLSILSISPCDNSIFAASIFSTTCSARFAPGMTTSSDGRVR